MMHENSMIAFDQINESGPGYVASTKELRRKAILGCYNGRPMRDYDILQKLFPGSTDMNLVRPRITELRDDSKIFELEQKARSHSGNRPVRLTQIITIQLELLLS